MHNCNRLTVLSPFLAPFLLVLDLALEIQRAPSPWLDQGLAFLSAFYRWGSAPSPTHSCDKYAHHGPLIYRNYKIVVAEFGYTSAIDDSCLLCAFLLSDKSRTIVGVLHLALLVPPVSIALAPPPCQVVQEYRKIFLIVAMAFAFYTPHFLARLRPQYLILLQALHFQAKIL